MSECSTCHDEGTILDAVSPYASDHAYPVYVPCPDCRCPNGPDGLGDGTARLELTSDLDRITAPEAS